MKRLKFGLLFLLGLFFFSMNSYSNTIPNEKIYSNPQKEIKTVEAKKNREHAEMTITINKLTPKKITSQNVNGILEVNFPENEGTLLEGERFIFSNELANINPKTRNESRSYLLKENKLKLVKNNLEEVFYMGKVSSDGKNLKAVYEVTTKAPKAATISSAEIDVTKWKVDGSSTYKVDNAFNNIIISPISTTVNPGNINAPELELKFNSLAEKNDFYNALQGKELKHTMTSGSPNLGATDGPLKTIKIEKDSGSNVPMITVDKSAFIGSGSIEYSIDIEDVNYPGIVIHTLKLILKDTVPVSSYKLQAITRLDGRLIPGWTNRFGEHRYDILDWTKMFHDKEAAGMNEYSGEELSKIPNSILDLKIESFSMTGIGAVNDDGIKAVYPGHIGYFYKNKDGNQNTLREIYDSIIYFAGGLGVKTLGFVTLEDGTEVSIAFTNHDAHKGRPKNGKINLDLQNWKNGSSNEVKAGIPGGSSATGGYLLANGAIQGGPTVNNNELIATKFEYEIDLGSTGTFGPKVIRELSNRLNTVSVENDSKYISSNGSYSIHFDRSKGGFPIYGALVITKLKETEINETIRITAFRVAHNDGSNNAPERSLSTYEIKITNPKPVTILPDAEVSIEVSKMRPGFEYQFDVNSLTALNTVVSLNDHNFTGEPAIASNNRSLVVGSEEVLGTEIGNVDTVEISGLSGGINDEVLESIEYDKITRRLTLKKSMMFNAPNKSYTLTFKNAANEVIQNVELNVTNTPALVGPDIEIQVDQRLINGNWVNHKGDYSKITTWPNGTNDSYMAKGNMLPITVGSGTQIAYVYRLNGNVLERGTSTASSVNYSSGVSALYFNDSSKASFFDNFAVKKSDKNQYTYKIVLLTELGEEILVDVDLTGTPKEVTTGSAELDITTKNIGDIIEVETDSLVVNKVDDFLNLESGLDSNVDIIGTHINYTIDGISHLNHPIGMPFFQDGYTIEIVNGKIQLMKTDEKSLNDVLISIEGVRNIGGNIITLGTYTLKLNNTVSLSIDGPNILDFKKMIYDPFNSHIAAEKIFKVINSGDLEIEFSVKNTTVSVPHTDGTSAPLKVENIVVQKIDDYNFRLKGFAEITQSTAKGQYSSNPGDGEIEIIVDIN